MEKRKLTITIGPSVIILAALVLACILLLTLVPGKRGERTLSIEDTPAITTRIQTLGELTTACFYQEIVLSQTKRNAFSVSPLGSIARDNFGKDVDDHLVLIARGTVRAGIDLRELAPDAISLAGDTLVIKLPQPRYLDVILNPSDVEVFAETGKWSHDEVTRLQNSARRRLLLEADQVGLKATAYDAAQKAVADFLKVCGYSCVRFEQPFAPICLPPSS